MSGRQVGNYAPRAAGARSDASLAELYKLARPIGECAIDELWQGQLHMELAALDDLDHAVAQLDQKLDALGQADARVIRLQAIPGVGERLSELVVAVTATAVCGGPRSSGRTGCDGTGPRARRMRPTRTSTI